MVARSIVVFAPISTSSAISHTSHLRDFCCMYRRLSGESEKCRHRSRLRHGLCSAPYAASVVYFSSWIDDGAFSDGHAWTYVGLRRILHACAGMPPRPRMHKRANIGVWPAATPSATKLGCSVMPLSLGRLSSSAFPHKTWPEWE